MRQHTYQKSHSYVSGRQFSDKTFRDSVKNIDVKRDISLLPKIGISLDSTDYKIMHRNATTDKRSFALDAGPVAAPPLLTTPSLPTPIQFLQVWLPNFVYTITAARKIDEVIGLSIIGDWEMSEVVQGIVELSGYPQPYFDETSSPLSSWNTNFVKRGILRYEEALFVGILEEAQASRMRADSGAWKRESAAIALEIVRNEIGFFGGTGGTSSTYGFLNDPNLPAYQNFPNGASGSSLWSTKTFLEITHDIQLMAARLQNQSLDQINPGSTETTLVVATAVYQYFSTVSNCGDNVIEWINQVYGGKMRIVSAPELNVASGGMNVAYMFADRINDLSTDDHATFIQPVQTKFKLNGVEKLAKGYRESYSNATAGAMCKRPWAVVRYQGN